MGLIDAMVNRSFRETQAGRIVVFSGDPRKRGYLVRSLAEEQKIRILLAVAGFALLILATILLLAVRPSGIPMILTIDVYACRYEQRLRPERALLPKRNQWTRTQLAEAR